ncbi:MAG: sigma-54 dependent transcriptional regulator [Kofleriaceae bacterium]
MPPSVLLVDDEADTADMLATILERRGYRARVVRSGPDALELVAEGGIDIVVTDNQMPEMTGVELCHQLSLRYPDVLSIILTGVANLETAVEAIRAGAYDFISKPVMADALEVALARAAEHRGLVLTAKRLRRENGSRERIASIIGDSPAMKRMTSMIHRAAPSDATVLITGESGTGKELVARALHDLSRKDKPFVAINCGAMPANLLESELFGHVKGAFTDARSSRSGLFIQAGEGTIFLDEIGEMPIEMQAKLLRALQERKVRPVGGDDEIPVACRVVAATNRDLEEEVAQGKFREDLFHRLNVIEVAVPSLRERTSDIVALVEFVLGKLAARSHKPVATVTAPCMRKLVDYGWPGNVRELENTLERMVAMSGGGPLEIDGLPPKVRDFVPERIEMDMTKPDSLVSLDEMKVRYAQQALDMASGNKTTAARMLGIDRRSLYRLLEKV